MTLKSKLRQLLEEHGRGSKSKLAQHLNVSPVYITRYAADEYQDVNMPSKYFLKTAEFFGIDPTYFFDDIQEIKPVSKVPIVGTASCGEPSESYSDGGYCYYNGEYFKKSLYCVIANGDSMSPEIEDGDEIICDPDVLPQNGDIVHYRIGNESAVKIYYKDDDAFLVQFIPYNSTPEFKTRTIRLDDDEAQSVKVAKVVAVNKLKFNNRASRLRLIGRV